MDTTATPPSSTQPLTYAEEVELAHLDALIPMVDEFIAATEAATNQYSDIVEGASKEFETQMEAIKAQATQIETEAHAAIEAAGQQQAQAALQQP